MTKPPGLFDKIDNTLLDLQQSVLQTYPDHIGKLGRLLKDEQLKPYVCALTKDVDLDAFLTESEQTQGSMVGSARLLWPEDERKILGLKLLLILKFSEDPDYVAEFGYRFCYTGSNMVMSGVHTVISQIIIPFFRDFREYVMSNGSPRPTQVLHMSNKVFIVHGHDEAARETVARFLEKIGFDPVILHEQPNRGRTIIEKIEDNADVGFAVVLLTPDDMGRARDADELEHRARQNVLLELGYFMARLGRDRVCALRRGEVSIPSDFAGVVWAEMDDGGGWRQSLARELEAAGHSIDWNEVMR